jgi:hypothetical protein
VQVDVFVEFDIKVSLHRRGSSFVGRITQGRILDGEIGGKKVAESSSKKIDVCPNRWLRLKAC